MTALDMFEPGSESLFVTAGDAATENREIGDFPPPCANDSPLGGVLALIRNLSLE